MAAGGRYNPMKRRDFLSVPLLAILPRLPGRQEAALTLPVTVRVRLFSTTQPSEIRVTTADGQSILINVRQTASSFRNGGPLTIQITGGKPIPLKYPLEVTAAHGVLVIVNEIPFEEYVAAVLAGESSGFKSDESLKAMAVAVRTYAAHFVDRHEREGFNFCDTTHCQDFRITAVVDRLRKAANETKGEILMYDGQPISAYYDQDCGGITEARGPYLQQLNDTFCVSRGRKRWTAELTAADIKSVIGVGGTSTIEIVERTNSGRARQLRITGSDSRVVSAEMFRLAVGRKLGWDKVRSDLYEVHNSEGRFRFDGFGAGNGIGLCQDGAAVMGEQGFTYEQILAYYYPNTRLSRLGI
jgi:stage II sporulation protein D